MMSVGLNARVIVLFAALLNSFKERNLKRKTNVATWYTEDMDVQYSICSRRCPHSPPRALPCGHSNRRRVGCAWRGRDEAFAHAPVTCCSSSVAVPWNALHMRVDCRVGLGCRKLPSSVGRCRQAERRCDRPRRRDDAPALPAKPRGAAGKRHCLCLASALPVPLPSRLRHRLCLVYSTGRLPPPVPPLPPPPVALVGSRLPPPQPSPLPAPQPPLRTPPRHPFSAAAPPRLRQCLSLRTSRCRPTPHGPGPSTTSRRRPSE